MLVEILSCLSLLTTDIDYGTPKSFDHVHLIQDSKSTDLFYVLTHQNQYRCKSSVPLNQNVQIFFPQLIHGLPQKIQYLDAPPPRLEEAQKSKYQVYKTTSNKLFKHEKINSFSAPAYSELISTATCEIIKNNSLHEMKSLEESVIKATLIQISDTLADWSEFMDAEDYGYDKTSKEREKSKKIYTEKLNNNLMKCQKSTDLDPATRLVMSKLDLYLNPKGKTSTKVLNLKTQPQKTSVPANK